MKISRRGAPLSDLPVLPSASALEQVRTLADEVREARIRRVHLVRSTDLAAIADPSGATRVWIATEALQVTGSFKVRGALNALLALLVKEQSPKVVVGSAGNHGAGMAYAANVLGIEATVVVPKGAPRTKIEKIEASGANVVVSMSDQFDDAEKQAKRIAETTGAKFISAYDDIDVVLGNGSSLGFEIAEALGAVPKTVLAPFGGGGLATGLSWAFAHQAKEPLLESDRVWGVQSEASPVMSISTEKRNAVTELRVEKTLAEGLAGGISESGFARAHASIAGTLVVSEKEIAHAMIWAQSELGLVIEGSAAASLAPLLSELPAELRGGDLVCVLTGRNVDAARIEEARSLLRF